MTASRDIHDVRPSSHQRQSLGAAAASLPSRPSHLHTASIGTLNATHRVNRRKSSAAGNPGINMAALAAAVKDASTDNKSRVRPHSSGETLGKAGSMHTPQGRKTSAIVDGPSLSSLSNDERSIDKARARRASEGSRLTGRQRRGSLAGEMRCETCGKGYKHGSCLTKHLWEHTPEWTLTSKLLISKHQQVQLLEAASVLVNMNQDAPVIADSSAIQNDSDMSSDSPAPSGFSDIRDDDDMSSRTSTPSQQDEQGLRARKINRPQRQDSYSETLSRSYQSAVSSSAPGEDGDLPYFKQWSSSSNRRPSTSGMSSAESQYDAEDQTDVAVAAQSLLSCSLGTPKHGPTLVSPDIPPVPPLPAKFITQAVGVGQHQQREIDMMGSELSRERTITEEDEGIFGTMEQ